MDIKCIDFDVLRENCKLKTSNSGKHYCGRSDKSCNEENCFMLKTKEGLPDSRNCAVRKRSEGGYMRCEPCSNKLCNEMFGTKYCEYHYDPIVIR